MSGASFGRRLRIVVLIGAFVSLIAPIYGAVSSFLWEENSELSDREAVIFRLHNMVHGPTSHFRRSMGEPLMSDCEKRLFVSSYRKPKPELLREGAYLRLRMARNADMHSSLYDLQTRGLRTISSPILGALDSCVAASPLSSLCRAFVSNKLMLVSAEKLGKKRAEVNISYEKLWCALAQVVDNKRSNPKLHSH